MKIGIYGDCHITKNMRQYTNIWENSVIETFDKMYDYFSKVGVSEVICLGDFFDSPRIEAKMMRLLIPIFDIISATDYPTYMLLGNHEIDSSDSNILELFTRYDRVYPIDYVCDRDIKIFVPYGYDTDNIDIKDKYIFTHQDIYGSDLAGGKTKAFFGINPEIYKDARHVYNGHVHLRSKVTDYCDNLGSLFSTQQGELRVGEYPSYYILDTDTGNLECIENKDSLIYLTIDLNDLEKVLQIYDHSKLILKVNYEGDLPKDFHDLDVLHISYHKIISDIESKDLDINIDHREFDMKNYIKKYIEQDELVSDKDKDDYISSGLEMLV